MVAVLTAAASPARAADAVPLIDATAIDHAVSPCENFYQFACGNWIKRNPIPPDRGRWSRFDALTELNFDKLRGILEAAAAGSDPATRKIGDFYASCMDEAGIEKKGLAPLREELAGIRAIAAMRSMPHPIGVSPRDSSPNGMRAQDTIAHGMTQKPVIGTRALLKSCAPVNAFELV